MEELVRLLKSARRIALISHIHPDGDAVGSTLGMYLGLQQIGKEVTATLVDGVPKVFHFLHGSSEITSTLPDPSETDLCIVLDASDASRTGLLEEIYTLSDQKKLGTIDHHPRGDLQKLSTAFYVRESSSCAELCYDILREMEVKLTPDIATALLVGMYTDTGAFQYENTTNETLELAAELMRRGGKLQKIASHVSHQKTVPALKLLGMALERVRLTAGGRCAVSVLTYKDMQEVGGSIEDTEGIIGALNVLTSVKVCLLLTEPVPGKIRGSLRTSEGHTTNVAQLAKLLGGAGHPRAAGFMLPGELTGNPETGWRVEPNLVS